jgi:quinol monooxygenase YgiN
MEAGLARSATRRRQDPPLMEAVQLDFHVTPMRAERFWQAYRTAVPRVLAYGASGYVFFRTEDDPDHFVHISYWEDRAGFERFWLSEEMREMRRKLTGFYGQPLLAHWGTILDQA